MYNTRTNKKTYMYHYNPTFQNSHTHFTIEGVSSLKTLLSAFILCLHLYKKNVTNNFFKRV